MKTYRNIVKSDVKNALTIIKRVVRFKINGDYEFKTNNLIVEEAKYIHIINKLIQTNDVDDLAEKKLSDDLSIENWISKNILKIEE